jgi:hypothetical protein
MIKPVHCPCKECTVRSASCHADCERYKVYSRYREQIRKVKHLEREARTAIIEHAVQRRANSYRKKGR